MDCNPLSNLNGLVDGITTPIAGNGAAFVEDGKTPVASKIVEDCKKNSTIKDESKKDASKYYYNASAAADFFAANDYGISISTFSAAGGNASTAGMPEDFPVLVVPPLGRITASKAIYGYISLLTNTPSDATTLKGKLKGSITAQTYQWDNGKFIAAQESSITVDTDGKIYVTPGKYDNTKNQFTLLTVPYQDPTDAKNSYVLYIPIVVQKQLKYRFYAAAIPGTIYNRDTYLKASSTAVSTHGEQITLLVSYEYDNTKSGEAATAEWQGMVNNGDNLLWNFDKEIVLKYESNDNLPAGTTFTLVDRNNKNKVYYRDGYDQSGSIALDSFEGYEKSYLCDILGLTAEKAPDGLFVATTTDDTNATLRIGETYYRLAADGYTGERFKITVNLTNGKPLEEYYLTIQTPRGSTEFANILFQCQNTMGNKDGNGMIPNIFVEGEKPEFARNNSENRIIFGDFFRQTVKLTTSTNEVISYASSTITANLEVTIEFKEKDKDKNIDWKQNFADYASAVKLYQRFELQARSWTENTSSPASFAERSAVIQYYNGDTLVQTVTAALGKEDVMLLNFPGDGVGVSVSADADDLNAATLRATVALSYTPAQIQQQFNTRPTTDSRDGLALYAFSHLAYSATALEQSNNPQYAEDTSDSRFYRKEAFPVTLAYNAGGASEDMRVNQLGINGRGENTASIQSVATYNISTLEAARAAGKICYSIQLYRKNDSGEFQEVDNNGLLTSGNATATLVSQDGKAKTVKLGDPFTGGIDISVPIRISLPLTVASGEGFTGKYANYKVELTVWLEGVADSSATDYIIYTNAKIKFPLVTSD